MVNRRHILKLMLYLTVAIFVLEISSSLKKHNLLNGEPFSSERIYRRFSVYGCSTPSKSTYRGFDYAFYLPLNVLAWTRVGYESLVVLIGNKTEWQTHPVLSHVLDHLDKLPDATVLFVPAKQENRMMLSQAVRIFIANMDGYPGQPSDFIITSDSDLWPLKKERFFQPERVDQPLTLWRSDCCPPFSFNGTSYTMLPMANIGASAATWKEIVNFDSSVVAKDSASILQCYQQVFGERVHQPLTYGTDDWYIDQKFVSIRIDQWIKRQKNGNCTYKVSDKGLNRIDRSSWNPGSIQPSAFQNYYDTHLPLEGFKPTVWESIKPLMLLMYGQGSSQIEWSNAYVKGFDEQFVKWKASASK